MSRLLVFPFDLLSHYLRCIALVRQYHGHEILFADSTRYQGHVKAAGYRTFNCSHFDAGKVMQCAEKFDFSWLCETDIEQIFLSQVQAIKKYNPHAVIGDASPTVKMAAEFTGVKFISLLNGYMTRYYAGTRRLSRIHPGYKHLKKLPLPVADGITRFAERMAFRQVHEPFKKVRKKYGLKNIPAYLHELEGDENLICDHPDVFPQKPLPHNYRNIGPLFNPVGDAPNLLHQSKPQIVISMGSSGRWELLKFLKEPEFSMYQMIAAGDKSKVLSCNHIISTDFIHLDTVLPAAQLLICHGGNGTIYHGLKHKVPMLCLPSHFEQEWNADRIQELGHGRTITGTNAAEIAELVHQLVQRKRYQKL